MTTHEPASALDDGLASLERVLGAQYEILRTLGRGGMGVVYLARERLLDRLVAIKVLRQENLNDESRERFLREARTAARLTHPNIVPLHSFGQSGDTVFYVMGYVEGESLEAYLQRVSRMSPPEASRILGELADALDYAHRNGVVHRDIKPDNVLVERGTGRAVLTDFGIAKLNTVSRLTQTGVVVGTPHYMSPEQAAGDREIDGRSDLYSLGVVAYRMLTGRLPFESDSLQGLLAAHASRFPAPVTQIVPDIDLTLSATVARCLEKSPDDRWKSAAALGASLTGLQGDSVSLPDEVADLPSRGVNYAIGLWVVEMITLSLYGGLGDPFLLQIAGMSIGFWVLLLSPNFIASRRAGLSARRTLEIMFTAPPWWSGWWPRRLRRPGDVWDRLPREVRDIRRGSSFMNVFGLGGWMLFAVPYLIYALRTPKVPGRLTTLFATGLFNCVVILPLIQPGWRFRRWQKALGLPAGTVRKLVSEPTWNSRFWSRPDIAPLLAPAVEMAFDETPPRTASSLVAAIEAMLAQLGELDPTLVRDVRETARATADALGDMEREIDRMMSAQSREEVEQMRARLPSFDDPVIRQMRQNIDDQLALLAQLEQRQRDLELRRDAGLARLHTLWLQIKALRAQRALESAEAAEITGRIRALCADVDRLRSALDEVNALTQSF